MLIRSAAVISARCCLGSHSSCIADSCDCYCHSALASQEPRGMANEFAAVDGCHGERDRGCGDQMSIFILLMLIASRISVTVLGRLEHDEGCYAP
jgi:hypothetical protein